MNRHRRSRLAALVAVPALVLLAACSSGSDEARTTDAVPPPAASDAPGAVANRSSVATDEDAGGATSQEADTATSLDRDVISTGTVSLSHDDVAEARRDVQRITDTHRGTIGEEETESDTDGEAEYARMVLRVPVAEFGDTIAALEEVGHLVSSSRTSEDVTTQVIDTNVRVRAQEASLKRVEALLARAEKLQQIVWIESQLTERRAELDSLRRQQAWLKDQTSLSTITVDISRRTGEDPVTEDEDGFLAGLAGGWQALTSTFTALATVAGAVLPFAVVLLVLGVPVWLLVRRARRRSPAAASTVEA